MGEVALDIDRPDRKLINGFKKTSTPTICEVMGKKGFMTSSIKPIVQGVKIAGPAITCLCHIGDNLMLHKALQLARAGDIIVVNHGGYTEAAPWGELMSLVAKNKRLEGIVIDGAVRDSIKLIKIGFPVFAKGTAMSGTAKESPGFVNRPINCGGIHVNPGDIIVGDNDGVMVVPKEIAKGVLEKAKNREEREAKIAKRIEKGEITDFMHVYNERYKALINTKELKEIPKA